jgi:hypothetical protein
MPSVVRPFAHANGAAYSRHCGRLHPNLDGLCLMLLAPRPLACLDNQHYMVPDSQHHYRPRLYPGPPPSASSSVHATGRTLSTPARASS